jgi:hypothetical protein
MTSPADAADNAYAIFLRSRSAVTAAHYPRRLDYTISVSGVEGDTSRANHYTASCDPRDGSIRVLPISEEELAAPAPHPHDFDFRQIVIQGVSVPVGHPPDPDLLGGSPILEPTYSFGLAYRRIAPPVSAIDTSDELPVIAVVSTKERNYDVSLLNTPVLNGEPTYHLRLVALRRPKEYRLRELWLGANDYLPRQALLSGNFTVAPLVDVPWLVTFANVDGVPYISRESAEATLYLGHRHVVYNAAITFENVRETTGSVIGAPLIAPDATSTSLVEP